MVENDDTAKIKNFLTANDDLYEKMEKFAQLTHAIGNFTVMPVWMNQGRGMSGRIKDYWDLTLRDSQKFLTSFDQGDEVWNKMIEKYKLQPFIDEKHEVKELWSGHFDAGRVMPQTLAQVADFYDNANLLIVTRGKLITKQLCENLNLTDLSFYKELVDNTHLLSDATTRYRGKANRFYVI
ncbi:hypothetical protein [Lactiplantibacillus daowaiensis]|uniref:Uncharacterized protein n=1 Tax=Lactiplantibacillus daowaiensis TaxID=2559918 RepID=A0ABW1S2C2_9LACO|nr:hypothetical protein [Lactiplantibacillus daowaiensis]